jgi:hypothetical protein
MLKLSFTFNKRQENLIKLDFPDISSIYYIFTIWGIMNKQREKHLMLQDPLLPSETRSVYSVTSSTSIYWIVLA